MRTLRFFFSFFVFFTVSFWGARRLSPENRLGSQVDSFSSVAREPSSIEFWTRSCSYVFAPRGPLFNVELFQRFLFELGQPASLLEPRDMQEALGHPEAFLAMLEHLSRDNEYRGVTFSTLLTNLKQKEFKKLRARIFSATKNGALSEYEMKKLFVDVYRITHQPQGFWKTLWKQKSLRETFAKIDDQKIIERIERSLFVRGMTDTYADIILDSKQVRVFREVMSRRNDWFLPLITAGLYGVGIAFRPELSLDPDLANSLAAKVTDVMVWIPALVPPLSELFDRVLSLEQIQYIKGLPVDEAKQKLYLDLKQDRKKGRALQTALGIYTVAFASLFYAALDVSSREKEVAMMKHAEEALNLQEEQNRIDEEKLLALRQKPIQQQAEEAFEDHFENLVAAGLNISKESTEYLDLKKGFIASFIQNRSPKK